MKTLIHNEKIAQEVVEILAERGIPATYKRLESGKSEVHITNPADNAKAREWFPIRKWVDD